MSTPGVDQDQCLSCMHHVLQAGHSGSSVIPQEEVEVPGAGRGSEHQELQITKVRQLYTEQRVS